MQTQNVLNLTISNVLGDDYLSVWIDSFIKDRQSQNLSKHTLRFYSVNLNLFSDYCTKQAVKNINQITSPFLRDFFLYLSSKGLNEGGINAYFRAIKAFLRWYWQETETQTTNPIDKVKPPKVIQESIKGIDKLQLNKLLSACNKNNWLGIRDITILTVLFETGIRASELCDIKLNDINLAQNSIIITQGKGRKPRTVFFGRSTRRQIRKYLKYRGKDGSYLFVNRTKDRMIYSSLRQILRRLCQKTGIKDISLHDFRRGFCLECLRKGMDLLTISRLMGHVNLVLLSRYANQTATDLQTAYKSILDDN